MSTLLLPAPPETELDRRASARRQRREAVDDRVASSAASRPMLSAWACGLDPSDSAAREKCRDINPELIIELL